MIGLILSIFEILFYILVVIGFIWLGDFFNDYVLIQLREKAKLTPWEGDDIVIKSVDGVGPVWGGIIGCYIFAHNIFVKPEVINFIDNGILIIFIISFTLVLMRICVDFTNFYSQKAGVLDSSVTLLENCIQIFICFIGLLIIIQTLGIAIWPLLTALGVGGVTIALAVRDSVASLFVGINILISSGLKPGHYIKLETGDEGYVEDIKWRYTTIKTITDVLIIIPNSKLSNIVIKNYSLPKKEMAAVASIKISNTNDFSQVEKIIYGVSVKLINEFTGCCKDAEPKIQFENIGYLGTEVKIFIKIAEFSCRYKVKNELLKNLKMEFDKEKIKLPCAENFGPAMQSRV